MVARAVTIEDSGLADALTGLIAAGTDMTPAMEQIGAALETTTQFRFLHGTAPGGNPWTPSRRAIAESGLTLVDSGALRDSITYAAGAREVEIGSNLIYARIHQLGGEAGRNKAVSLPSRPYLPDPAADDEEQSIVKEILVDFIGRAAAARSGP